MSDDFRRNKFEIETKGLKGGESISGSKSSEADSEISAPLVQAIVAAAHRWLERHTAECHTAGVSGTPLGGAAHR